MEELCLKLNIQCIRFSHVCQRQLIVTLSIAVKACFPLTYFAAAGEKFRHVNILLAVLWRHQQKVKHAEVINHERLEGHHKSLQ